MSASRLVLTVGFVLAISVLSAVPHGWAAGRPARAAAVEPGGYRPPVGGPLVVVRPFDPPPTRYAAGHRGVDLALAEPLVLAAGGGVVSFAGVVGDRGVVVIRHPDGVSTEYEPLTPSVRRGSQVAAGQPIGTVSGRHAGCAAACVHWGARRNGAYLDPIRLLQPLGVVRLLPDG